jgi:hypothetical protein
VTQGDLSIGVRQNTVFGAFVNFCRKVAIWVERHWQAVSHKADLVRLGWFVILSCSLQLRCDNSQQPLKVCDLELSTPDSAMMVSMNQAVPAFIDARACIALASVASLKIAANVVSRMSTDCRASE